MLNHAYSEVIEDDQHDARQRENEVLQISIDKMSASENEHLNIAMRQEAINFTTRVWSYMLDDLTSHENQNSDELKASLISIGIYFMKYLEKMRKDSALNFKPLIDISRTILQGLG